MLLDYSYSNIILENLGTSLSSLVNTANTLIYTNFNLTFDFINEFLNTLNLWTSEAQQSELSALLPLVFYSSSSYNEFIGNVITLFPGFYSLDSVNSFYLKNIFFNIYLSQSLDQNTVFYSNLFIDLKLNIFYDIFFNKWAYLFFSLFVVYFFSNIMKFRYQYGFNFYFTYFKTLADLGEQEYGSYDDYKFFVFFLVQMFVWYCWVFFVGYTFSTQSESKLVLLTISVMLTILSIPVRLLWDFGLAFGMYVRGAASSSNLIVEAFFDIIGVIIIFTRFVVQNIRFLLVFVAFFELFEWVATTVETNYYLQLTNNTPAHSILYLDPQSIFSLLLNTIKASFIYLYHLLHLIIVSFMQIGVYLMVSFWLFFFLYTSFFKITLDNYFSVKRNK